MVERTLQETNKFLGVGRGSFVTIPNSNVDYSIKLDTDFDSMFHPNDMRLFALVFHDNMEDAMKQFVIANKNVLKKFRLTGTDTTMTMLKEVFDNNPEVIYGPSCQPGPLGGDAQLIAMAATGQLGGCIFFVDPMDAHPHSADIECLNRQGNVHNILMMHNPNTAHVCLNALRVGLKLGRIDMMPSFFFDLESPSVKAYKNRQKHILEEAIKDSYDVGSSPPPILCDSSCAGNWTVDDVDGRFLVVLSAANKTRKSSFASLSPSSFDHDEGWDIDSTPIKDKKRGKIKKRFRDFFRRFVRHLTGSGTTTYKLESDMTDSIHSVF